MRDTLGAAALLLVLSVSITACGDGITPGDQQASIPSVTREAVVADEGRVTLLLNEQIRLIPATTLARSPAWMSSNTDVATVTSRGVAQARTVGSAVIIARSLGFTDSTLVVVPRVAEVLISVPTAQLRPGEQTVLSAKAVLSTGDTVLPRAFTWRVERGNAVTVSDLGAVTAVSPGSATISTTAGGVKGMIDITVQSQAPVVTAFTLSPKAVSVPTGGTVQFSVATIWSDGGAYAAPVSFTTSGEGSISMSGIFTAAQVAGTFAVIATCSCGRADTAQVTVAPSAPTATTAELPRVYLDDMLNQARTAAAVRTINVSTAAQLQSALDTARYGDHIVLQAGTTYRGAFVLRRKSGTGWITIRSNASPSALPPAGTRMRPGLESLLPKIVAASPTETAIRTESRASGYRLFALEVMPPAGSTFGYTLMALGSADTDQTTLAAVPSSLVLDRVYVHGINGFSFQRCLALNSASTVIVDSWLSECHGKGFDSQAIAGWNGPGPFMIVNNHLEGAGENVMFGGADPRINGTLPSDIEIRRNHFYKPLDWKGVWTVKNSLELKIGKRVLVEGNIFENNWADAQNGFAIVLKSVNQDNSAPWSETADVTFRNNIVRNSFSGMSLSGSPEGVRTVPMSRVTVVNNAFERIDQRLWEVGEVDNLSFVSNTGFGVTHGLLLIGRPMANLVVRDNVFGVPPSSWAAISSADGKGWGTQALNAHASSWTLEKNVIPLTPNTIFPNTLIPPNFDSLGLVGWPTDLRLPANSPYRSSSSTGSTPGADFVVLGQWTAGVIVAP